MTIFAQGDLVRFDNTLGQISVGAVKILMSSSVTPEVRRYGPGGGARFRLAIGNGSQESPSPTLNGDVANFQFEGATPAGSNIGAPIQFAATENWTNIACGYQMELGSCPVGSTATTRNWIIQSAGNFVAAIDNTVDIGVTAATRPRRIFAATAVQVEANGAAGTTTGLCLTNQVDQAGASAGTLANAPSVGNPSFWLPVNINGALRKIPCWT